MLKTTTADLDSARSTVTEQVSRLAAESKARVTAEESIVRLQEDNEELERDLKASQEAYQLRNSTLSAQLEAVQQRATQLDRQLSDTMARSFIWCYFQGFSGGFGVLYLALQGNFLGHTQRYTKGMYIAS